MSTLQSTAMRPASRAPEHHGGERRSSASTLLRSAGVRLRRDVRPWLRWAALGGALTLLVSLLLGLLLPDNRNLSALFALSVVLTGPQGSLVPGTHEPVLMAYASEQPLLLVAIVAALGAAVSECLNYVLYAGALRSRWLSGLRSSRLATLGSSERFARTRRAFARWPFLAVASCSFAPVPFWLVRLASTAARYSPRRHVVAFTLGRVPRYWLLASLGTLLPLGRGQYLAVAALAATLALTAAAWRGWQRRERPAVVPTETRLPPT